MKISNYINSEIQETMSIILALSKRNIEYTAYSFDAKQTQVCNHITGEVVENEERNMMVESSRIMRKPVFDIATLSFTNYNGLIIPGGFGVAKNFCDYAFKGDKFTVDPIIEQTLTLFRKHNIPIAACCIAPIILAKVFGKHNHGPGVNLTFGLKENINDWPFQSTIELAHKLGNHTTEVDVTECNIDKEHKIVTTPAYLKAVASPIEVYTGIDKMIDALNKLMH